jgi:hypothetical protein
MMNCILITNYHAKTFFNEKDGRNLILTTSKILKTGFHFIIFSIFTTNQYFVYEKNYSDVFYYCFYLITHSTASKTGILNDLIYMDKLSQL